MATLAVKRLGAKRIAIVDDRTAYGAGLADTFEATVKRLGAEVVAREFGADKTTDFRKIVLNLEAAEPDLVVCGGMDTNGAHLAAQMRRQGLKAVLMGGDGMCSSEFITLARGGGEATVCTMAGEAVEKMSRGTQFAEKYRKRFNGDVQIYSPYTYDAIYVIADALKRAGTTQSEALIVAIKSTNMVGVTGAIRFDAKGDVIDGAISVFRVKSGKLEYVETIR